MKTTKAVTARMIAITKIIETELVVGTEGDICQVCLATLVGIRTVLVDAIYRETVEHPSAYRSSIVEFVTRSLFSTAY